MSGRWDDAVGNPNAAQSNRLPVQRFLHAYGINDGPWLRRVQIHTRALAEQEAHLGFPGRKQFPSRPDDDANVLMGGLTMELANGLVRASVAEVEESRAVLQRLHNDIVQLREVIEPLLMEQAKTLRTARMTVVNEVNASLVALRDVRKFFLESDYATEMARLERFVALCRELQALKAEGVLDAISDTALRLAVGEPTP